MHRPLYQYKFDAKTGVAIRDKNGDKIPHPKAGQPIPWNKLPPPVQENLEQQRWLREERMKPIERDQKLREFADGL